MRDGIDSFVLVADLDGFKGFNDRYGHSAGDEALRQFAGALGLAARGTDILGRLGGDEFGILLVRCQETAVRGFTTRVREAMAIVADSRLGKLDVSLGHASLPGSTSAAKGGFENPWHITAPLQEPGKQLLVFACQGNVMSVLVERAQVHMAQAVSKAVEERSALFKRRVDLLRVSYVEAQAGEQQLVEDRRQLVNRLARLLSGVHVLDDEAPPDGLPGVEVLEQIGVHHDRANS